MASVARRRAIAAVLLTAVVLGAWYLAQPRVPEGQPSLLTLDAASLGTLRDTFNRDAEYVRVIVLPSPT